MLSQEAVVADAVRRARLAKFGLLAIGAVYVARAGALVWMRSLLVRAVSGDRPPDESFTTASAWIGYLEFASIGSLIVCAALFLRWLHKTTTATRMIGTKPFRWTPQRAVSAFFIPFVNFARPYHVLRDLHDSLSFESLPRPKARVVEGGSVGYRDAAVIEPPAPPELPRAFIAAWWAMYVGGGVLAWFLGRGDAKTAEELIPLFTTLIVHSIIEIVAALLAVRVVVAVTARLAERYRRLQFAGAPSAE